MLDLAHDNSGDRDALERLREPWLSDIRDAVKTDWSSAFVDPDTQRGILENPRLQSRILGHLTTSRPFPSDAEFTQLDGVEVIQFLLDGQRQHLAQTLGLIWNHATVLEWITWNQLGKHLPRVRLLTARQAITLCDPETFEAAGAPTSVRKNLTEKRLLADGEQLISIWCASLPETMFQRMCLFIELDRHDGDERAKDLVCAVAKALQAGEGSS